MKKINYIIFTFIVMIIGSFKVFANTYNYIDMDINIDKNGNMKVKEVWDVETNQNTEIFIPKYNLGNITISDFRVKDEKRQYTKKDYWNVYDSFEEKAYKYGINNTANGPELCFGISEYSSKQYTVEYTLNNAVFSTEDADVLYIELINKSESGFDKFNIDIEGPVSFEDTLDVWGYGYNGVSFVEDGKIILNDYGNTLNRDEYVVLLVKFPKNIFNIDSNNKYEEYTTFDDVFIVANEDSYEYPEDENVYYEEYVDKNDNFAGQLSMVAMVVVGILLFLFKKSLDIPYDTYIFGPSGKDMDKDNIPYFRDIPCNKDIFTAYFLVVVYNLNSSESDFLGAVILKWLKENKISVNVKNVETQLGDKEVMDIDLTKYKLSNYKPEDDLYNMFNVASKDGVLEELEFKKYLDLNYNKVLDWFNEVEKNARNIYIKEKLISMDKNTGQFLVDDKVKEEAIKLYGLYKYLKDFSLIHEKVPMEVKLWKEYLMFAQLFGIADEVADQFAKFYPEIAVQLSTSEFKLCGTNNFTDFGNYVLDTANTSKTRSERVYSKDSFYSGSGGGNYHSGGGGHSFGGGGGGAHGGGGRSGSR